MKARPVLALLAGRPDPAHLTEWLRVVAAAAAVGLEVRLREVGGGRGVLAGPDLPPDAERYLEGLEALGVQASSPDEATLRGALGEAGTILRLGDPSRSRTPSVLTVTDAWLGTVSPENLGRLLRDAGQVVRGAAP